MTSSTRYEGPKSTGVLDLRPFFKVLLRGPDSMLPFLTVVAPVNHTIDRVITEIGMDRLYSQMNLPGRLWSVAK
jgi:hypothetical protein